MNALVKSQRIMARVLIPAAIIALVALSGCPSQVPAPCQIQSPLGGVTYTVKLTNKGAATANCPAEFGDFWFFDAFPGGLIVMRSSEVPLPVPSDPNSTVFGRGKFSAVDPDSSDLCYVPSIERAFEGPGGTTYNTSNLAFLSTALYIGEQWKGDIEYTINGETCSYSGQALWPSVDCNTNTDCDPTNFPTPSGINNLFDQGCHTEPWAAALSSKAGECFFNKEFPSLGGFKH